MSGSSESDSEYARGARILSVGIATTGLVTFAYFSLASHALSEVEYKRISLLWSIMFVIVSVIYRPIEQLLSRTIADRRARGLESGSMRVPLLIQGAFAAVFLAVALAARGPLQDDLFDGSARALQRSSWWVCSRTRRATSRAASSPATSASRCMAASSSSRRRRASASRSR